MPDSTIPRRRKGPHEAVLEAAFTLLATEGYAKMTMEGIAQAAKVGKPTLYRWWNSKADIVLEAAVRNAEQTLPPPDTGSIRSDFFHYLTGLFALLNAGGNAVARSLVAEASLNADFGLRFKESFVSARRTEIRLLLERAHERGELKPDVPIETAVDMFFGPVWYRLILAQNLDEQFAIELTSLLCGGLLAAPPQ